MKTKVGINGFGRIGRNTFKALEAKYAGQLEVVAVNDLTDAATLAHLLKYDSIYGRYPVEVKSEGQMITVNGRQIQIFSKKDPGQIHWKEAKVDIVIESTPIFKDRISCTRHLEAGARKVLISSSAKDEDLTIVMGVNEHLYQPGQHHILSNATCTTNALAPIVKVLDDTFGLQMGLMTTVHSYTNDQKIHDQPHSDMRRARAAALNIIPTTTGAAKAVTKVLPHLKGKLNGLSVRVPTPTVSLVDLVAIFNKNVGVKEVNDALKYASENQLKGILGYTEEDLVSMDFKQDDQSAVIDAGCTMAIGENMVKVLAWYDNEWGYSSRLADLAAFVAGTL